MKYERLSRINEDQINRQSKFNHVLFSNMSYLLAPARWPNWIFGIETQVLVHSNIPSSCFNQGHLKEMDVAA